MAVFKLDLSKKAPERRKELKEVFDYLDKVIGKEPILIVPTPLRPQEHHVSSYDVPREQVRIKGIDWPKDFSTHIDLYPSPGMEQLLIQFWTLLESYQPYTCFTIVLHDHSVQTMCSLRTNCKKLTKTQVDAMVRERIHNSLEELNASNPCTANP